MDLISREELIEAILEARREETDTIPKLIRFIEKRPTAEPKTGRWEYNFADNGWQDVSCSECGYTENVDIHVRLGYNYCPNCGADMRGEQNG